MSLTNEQKAAYVAAIDAIWPGLPSNNIGNISDEVAEIMDTVLDSIKTCSKALAGVEAVYDVFYDVVTGTSWRDVLVSAIGAIAGWIDSVRTDQLYRICVVVTAANWRSAIQMALMGIKR
jgi:hypothetical protein